MNKRGYVILESLFYIAACAVVVVFCLNLHVNCAIFQRNIDSKLEIVQQGTVVEEFVKKRVEEACSVTVSKRDLHIEQVTGRKSVIRFDKASKKLFFASEEHYTGYEFGDYVEDFRIEILANNIVDVKIDFKKGKLKHRIDFRVKNRNAQRNSHISGF